MTERGLPLVNGAPACPFVAFEDDRDERASAPDHRHRCYAEIRPAPRALAHQEAYCLSSAFPVCPTFQDWARREAARARPGPTETSQDEPPPRNPPRDWSAPPSWSERRSEASSRDDTGDEDEEEEQDLVGGAAAAAAGSTVGGAAGAGRSVLDDRRPLAGDDEDAPDFATARSGRGAGLAGSPADRLAGGEAVGASARVGAPSERIDDWAPADRFRDREGDAIGGDVGRAGFGRGDLQRDDSRPNEYDRDEDARRTDPPRFGPDRRPRVGATRRSRPPVDPAAPSWEQPRRYEAYPTLRTRMNLPNVPRVGVMAIALIVAAIALFFLPTLLGVGNGPQTGSTQPSPSAAVQASMSIEPTAPPAPTPLVYVVQSGDTLEKIRRKFGVTMDALLAANPQIKNPNRIRIGDEITIPTADASAAPKESPSGSG